MLSADGCRERRNRFWERLQERVPSHRIDRPILLADPIHLIYLANFWVDPFSLGAGFGGYLLLERDGHATLFHENRLPASVECAHVDAREVVDWYDGKSPAGPRQLAIPLSLPRDVALPAHDQPGHPQHREIVEILTGLRRSKLPDEVDLLRRCMRATEAGHAWARSNIHVGMTEHDVYCGVNTAAIQNAGHPVIVYGDFAVSTGPERTGGPPTDRVLEVGDMFILDFSVVIAGYRSDFTNTLVVGGEPATNQCIMHGICVEAMEVGEALLRTGTPCREVYQAVHGKLVEATVADHFPHHAGHGLGLTHPEAPYLVRNGTETLQTGDVVTLEPGLYIGGMGGIRIENNYLIHESGFERLSNHVISLK